MYVYMDIYIYARIDTFLGMLKQHAVGYQQQNIMPWWGSLEVK